MRRPSDEGDWRVLYSRNAAAICLAYAACSIAYAQAPAADVIVSASGLPMTETTSDRHVTAITRQEILSEGASNLTELLRRRSGIVIDRSSASGGFGSVFLRGSDPSHVAIVVDGVPQNDPLSSRGSAADLNSLSIDDVERIEIVRGNSFNTYTGALAGVIHVITRRRDDPRLSGYASLGGNDQRSLAASAGSGAFKAGLAQSQEGDTDSGRGSWKVRSANAGFETSREHQTLNIHARVADHESYGFPDDSGGWRYAALRDLEHRTSRTLQGTSAYEFAVDAHNVRFDASYVERDHHLNSPGVSPGVRDSFGLPATESESRLRGIRGGARWLWNASPIELHSALNYEKEHGQTDTRLFFGAWLPTDFELSRETTGATFELRGNVGRWTLQSSGRYSRVSDQDDFVDGSAGLRYDLLHAGAMGVAISKAHKAPSFYALADPYVGNADLNAESTRQAEVFYALPTRRGVSGRITAFTASFDNLIDFDAGPPPRLVNRSGVTTRGIELDLHHHHVSGATVFLNATALEYEIPGSIQLRHRPKFKGTFGAQYPLDTEWNVSVNITSLGRRYDSSIATGDVWLSKATFVSLMTSWKRNQWSVFAALDNVLDRKNEETIGTPSRGRSMQVSVQYRL